MAGLCGPPSAVLGRDGAASSLKNDVVDMPTMARDKEFGEARRNVYPQATIKNAMEDLLSTLRRRCLQIWTSTACALTYVEVHAGLENATFPGSASRHLAYLIQSSGWQEDEAQLATQLSDADRSQRM
jgi:hypothetical protein